jgi:hypothetical protein
MQADQQIKFRKLRGRTMVPMSEIIRIQNGEPLEDEDVEGPKKHRPKKVKLSLHISAD